MRLTAGGDSSAGGGHMRRTRAPPTATLSHLLQMAEFFLKKNYSKRNCRLRQPAQAVCCWRQRSWHTVRAWHGPKRIMWPLSRASTSCLGSRLGPNSGQSSCLSSISVAQSDLGSVRYIFHSFRRMFVSALVLLCVVFHRIRCSTVVT